MAFPMLGRAGQVEGSPFSSSSLTTCPSVGPYWLQKRQPGSCLKRLAIAGVIFNCSPLVKTSFKVEGTSPVRSTASARYCKATKGTMMRLIRWAMILRSSCVLFRRSSSVISTSVPPCANVVKISWKLTSKLMGANWSVRSPALHTLVRSCHWIRLVSGAWCMATPLGRPVLPLVKST